MCDLVDNVKTIPVYEAGSPSVYINLKNYLVQVESLLAHKLNNTLAIWFSLSKLAYSNKESIEIPSELILYSKNSSYI